MAKRIIKKNEAADFITLSQAYEEFIQEKVANNLSNYTLISYENTFKAFCKFSKFDADTLAKDITEKHIFHWIGSMKLEGLQTASINHYLRDIRTILYWCMDKARLYIDKPFKVKLLTGQEEQLKLYTDEEIELLLEKPKRYDSYADWRSWAIISWVLGTGNRASTICNVKLTDINFNRKEISLWVTKNNIAQIIPLSSSLEIVLKEFIRTWRKDAPVGAYLFANVGEEQLTTNALRLAHGRYCASRGVDKSNIHGLRHNFAKGWVRNNGNMFALQKILGHQSLEMTRKYVRLFSEDIKEDFDKFSPLDTIKRNAKRTQNIKRNFNG